MDYNIILVILVTHFVADFLCQTDKMALNKSHSIKWLSVHVLVYSLVLGLGSLFFLAELGWEYWAYYVLTNGILHWITDYFTSKQTTRLWKLESKHWFFVMVGFDQLIHYSCLFSTYLFIGIAKWRYSGLA